MPLVHPATFIRFACCFIVVLMTATSAQGELSVASLFSESMVIQRDQPTKVWGWGEPGTEVRVVLADQPAATSVDVEGRWAVILTPPREQGPHTMSITDGMTTLNVGGILVGEVWLCSGQSNMAMTVNRAADFKTEAEMARYPEIRMFRVTSGHATTPQEKCAGSWTVCTPETVGGFSATGYFFGRRLHKELNVPIGLINSSVGGTSVESWTSMEAQAAVAEIKPRLDAWNESAETFDLAAAKSRFEKTLERWKTRAAEARQAGSKPPRRPQLAQPPRQDRNYPSNLFNGKINPIIGYSIKGAIWYQGENSSGRGFSHLYGPQLSTLITDWRNRWGLGEFPFAWVQLPNFRTPQKEPSETNGWTLVQEGMLKTLSVSNTGMAITLDAGEAKDIHPKDKQTVGHRLAQWALASVYHRKLIPMGPIFRSFEITGNQVTISFDYADGLKSDGDVRGFAICGNDRKFVWADAKISGKTVIVSSKSVPAPVSVRYAWAANPVHSLTNKDGIPASPFRTDTWEEQGR